MKAAVTYHQGLNVRTAPTKQAPIAKVLKLNETVEAEPFNDEWVSVEGGFCMKRYLRFNVGQKGRQNRSEPTMAELRRMAEEKGLEVEPGIRKADLLSLVNGDE